MKKFLSIILLAAFVFALVGCVEKLPPADLADQEAAAPVTEAKTGLNIAGLKGPTALGMLAMLDDDQQAKTELYNFQLVNAPDQVAPLLKTGEVDIAAIPGNMASVLYNKFEGDVVVLAINTLGVLYIVERGAGITNLLDLTNGSIALAGQGATPDYVLQEIFESYGIQNVTFDYKAEHQEVVQALVSGQASVGLLPEPFLSAAMLKDPGIYPIFDCNWLWQNRPGVTEPTDIVMGVVVARREVVENRPEEVKAFLEDYKASIETAKADILRVAKLSGEYDIVPEPVAQNALANLNIAYIDGVEMQQKLGAFLETLYAYNPQAVGGKLPYEDFYFIQQD